jgi:hypothetical protein
MPQPSVSSTFMPQFKNEAEVNLPSGIKVRFYRNEPFKFLNDIHKFLEGLNIGEIQVCQMNTDANGWCNFVIAYREPAPPKPEGPDPAMVLFDTVMALKDLTDVVNALGEKLLNQEDKDGGS